ncbi:MULTISPECIES: hypothetical protein [Cyanophyceae]|uniref:hypothetical protein n=1 Tax=Cyanophyceae TaxID=3028117 RepID=UPI00168871CB|nr:MULTISPECIES: hypothetical protein [Cyanophyceae]MBD1916263.1 hypothetical protein [Phormidium sp. FACHB-77]MBD2028389.1 hypothetical protein [Phormidium sp. FACHB-322]MBD2051868.1 hypothetical protein [Leptolyngbya sp. FACHB-60]
MNDIPIETGFYISYQQSSVDEKTLENLRQTSFRFGPLEERSYDSKSGAIDLGGIVTFGLGGLMTLTAATFVRQPINEFMNGFWNELLGEGFFKSKGADAAEFIKMIAPRIARTQKLKIDYYLYELFQTVVFNQLDNQGAYEIYQEVDVNGKYITFFVVLNHYDMTTDLILNLSDSFLKAVAYLRNHGIPNDNPGIVQLYPDWESCTWRYLFIPSNNAFGKFIDTYIDLTDGKIYSINSPRDFVERFNVKPQDKFKLIISPRNGDQFLLDDL